MDDDEIKFEEDIETDFIVYPITPEKNLLAYALYFRLMSYERHYADALLKIKRLCITWLMASLIGISFLLSSNIESPFSKFTMIIILCLLAIKGIALLWFLDIFLYYPAGYPSVQAANLLEKKFDFLPKLHFDMKILIYNKKRDPAFYRSFYYASCVLMLFSIITFCIYNNVIESLGKNYALAISLSFISVIIFTIFRIVDFTTKKITIE